MKQGHKQLIVILFYFHLKLRGHSWEDLFLTWESCHRAFAIICEAVQFQNSKCVPRNYADHWDRMEMENVYVYRGAVWESILLLLLCDKLSQNLAAVLVF